MGIINDFKNNIEKLTNENRILREKIRLLEIRMNNLTSKLQLPVNNISTPPVIDKTLDVNNIWMGEKSENKYNNIAKMELIHDEEMNKWRPVGYAIYYPE